MRIAFCTFAFFVLSLTAMGQVVPTLDAFEDEVGKLRLQTLEKQKRIEQAFDSDFKAIKERFAAAVEEQRIQKMKADDLEAAIQLRALKAKIMDSSSSLQLPANHDQVDASANQKSEKDPVKTGGFQKQQSSKSQADKRTEWTFAKTSSTIRLRSVGKWEENHQFIWIEKYRSDSNILLYDPSRDFWAS